MQSQNTNGPENGVSAHQKAIQVSNTISRPFTLQESLPYSPQTSTAPFIPELIPDSSIGVGSPALRIAELFPRHEYDRLNKEAFGLVQLPRNTKQAVDLVLHDLKPSQRTKYNFKAVPINQTGNRPTRSLSKELSPIAKAVYEKVGGYFKATKAVSASPKILTAEAEKLRKPSKESTPFTPRSNSQVPRASSERFEERRSTPARIEVAIPSKNFDPSLYLDFSPSYQSSEAGLDQPPEPPIAAPPVQPDVPSEEISSSLQVDQPQLPLNIKPSTFRVELPSSQIKRDEYLEVAYVPDAPKNLSVRKTEQETRVGSEDPIGVSLDQRQRAEVALDAFESLIKTIFTAVGKVLGMEPGYEHIITLTADQEPTMTSAMQHKLHGAVQKLINLRCFDKTQLETLLQVIKLSEGSLRVADRLDLRVEEGWDEASLEAWLQKLPDVETALKAARTILRVLSGGRADKQLYSEDVITKCIDLFKGVIEDIIVPVVELRNSAGSNIVFKTILKNKKDVSTIFVSFQKLFALLTELITKIEFSETVFSTLEFTASKLIFVENAYFEKDSAIGVQKFDGIRSIAMDMLCQIFLMKPVQRQGIIDDILTSLEKLPIGKQSSRQFKLSDGGSIQPVSALLMRLVQASSGRVVTKLANRSNLDRILDGEKDGSDDEDESQGSKKSGTSSMVASEEQGAQLHSVAIQELEAVVVPLCKSAEMNASYVIKFIVKRAIGSTKSGDTPYRNLLDLFVEDFTTCLDLPDWPSAELLLRLLMIIMVQLFEAPKTAAPAKNMALEILGTMSAAISRLRSHVKRTASSLEGNDVDDLSRYLSELAFQVLDQKSRIEQIVAWDGPFRSSLECLQGRLLDDPYLSSAISYFVTDWGTRIHNAYHSIPDEDAERDEELGRLAFRLRMMVGDRGWLSNEYLFRAVTTVQAKLSYSMILLRSPLCESFGKILNILLGSMASDQATVRSKSLKSVNQVIETDPSILDTDSSVIQLILHCSSDSSTQVRDSALGLLGNCISMRPLLESSLTPKIIDRFQDAGVGVRKRAMKLARDIYLRNRAKWLRSAIANGLLRRVQDPDEGVRDLARQTIEEIWFAPFYGNDGTAAFQTSLTEHVALVIHTVKTGNVTEILDKVFQTILRPKDKSLEGPFSVCSKLVAHMFSLIDNPETEDGAPSGRDALQVLTIFAKADPKLFNFEQIRLLKPNLASFTGPGELSAFRAVNVIYKRVLPCLPTLHNEFLSEVRLQLLKGIGKISSRGALNDLIACTRVVCDLLKDFAPMANMVASCLTGIQKLGTTMDTTRINHLAAYSIIVGCVGKHCDLDQQIQIFRARFPKWKGDSVPRFIVDVLSAYTTPSQPLEARKAGLEAIGLICQSWPRNYVLAKVYTSFQQVFHEQTPILEAMILRSFKEFLLTEEKRSEVASEAGSDGKKKELTVMGGTNFDDVASATTQRFLPDITRIALGSQDEHAFLAMEILGSINRQGLTHPKETGVTLITLETSANRKIAELAYTEHRSLHEKHETVLEREYIKAVQSAYNYQRDVVKDSHGALTEPYQSKLHLMIEVLKISKMKNRQRFFEKLCTQVNFDLAKLDLSGHLPPHIEYSRFIIENMAFFEYQTVGELQSTVNTMEKIVTTTGASVAQLMESELFSASLDFEEPEPAKAADEPMTAAPVALEGEMNVDGPVPIGEPPVAAPPLVIPVEPRRLRQFTTAAIILLSLWEARSYLRRLYGMGTHRHDNKAKALAKDLHRSPVKVQGIHSDKVFEEIAAHISGLNSNAKMMQKCKAFVELMNVDKEFKVENEDDEMGLEAPVTPSEADEDDEVPDRGRKRKGAGTPGGRKKRQRSNSQPRKRGRPRKQSSEQNDEVEDDMDWV